MYTFDFSALHDYALLFLRGAGVTLWLTLVSTACGLLLGLGAANISLSKSKIGSGLIATYVEIIRNTPFLIQMFVIFFGLPVLGIQLSEMWSGFFAMTINITAYSSEILRSGISAVSDNQKKAGLALGFTRIQSFFHVVLPQAVAKVYPSLKSQILLTMLASSVFSQISIRDLTYESNFIQGRTFRAFEVFIMAAVIYLALSLFISFLMDFLIKKRVMKGTHS